MIHAITQLEALAQPAKAAEMAAYHKAKRPYLGVSNPQIDILVKSWRAEMTITDRVDTAAALWDSNIHEARIAAGKLLTQARIRTDEPLVWAEILRWVSQFDAWAIADHTASAGARRITADLTRLDVVERWTQDPNFWVRRAALVFTLPFSKGRHLSADHAAARERILSWAAGYADDREWFIQKSIGWWLRSLSKHDPDRVRQFLDVSGAAMKPFARREAAKYL